MPEVRARRTSAGTPEVSQALVVAQLKDWSERDVSQQSIVQKILPQLRKVAGVQASASNPASLGVRGFGKPLVDLASFLCPAGHGTDQDGSG